MPWTGAVLFGVIALLMGGVLISSNMQLKAKILDQFGLHSHSDMAAEHGSSTPAAQGESHAGKKPEAPAEFERGPNNGRLLRDGDFALEITIFETGVPPEFHFYAYQNDKPVNPANVKATAELSRLDGQIDRITFAPDGDHLKGSSVVVEPHSFDVTIKAEHAAKAHEWRFSSYEGRTHISDTAAAAGGMKTETAGPASIDDMIVLTGSIVLNQNTTGPVKSRYPGIVKKVMKNVGDTVKEGEVLAVIDANTSLTAVDIKAPFSGTILERSTNVGDIPGAAPLFVIADLRSVWAEFHVFSRDLPRVKAGQTVLVKNFQGADEQSSTVALFTPVAELSSQSLIARVLLDNSDGRWKPGMSVRGEVLVNKHQVPLAVKTSALQRFRDFTVVFAKVGENYEVRMLELGASDGTWTEVKGGLKPGTTYVAENSFLVKADIEKSGASHDH